MYASQICAGGIFVTFPCWLKNVKSRSKIALFSNERHFDIWFPKQKTITFFWSKLSKLHKKDPILHVATTFSLKQGETRTSHGPIPHPLSDWAGTLFFFAQHPAYTYCDVLNLYIFTVAFPVIITCTYCFLWPVTGGLKFDENYRIVFMIILATLCWKTQVLSLNHKRNDFDSLKTETKLNLCVSTRSWVQHNQHTLISFNQSLPNVKCNQSCTIQHNIYNSFPCIWR